MNLSRL